MFLPGLSWALVTEREMGKDPAEVGGGRGLDANQEGEGGRGPEANWEERVRQCWGKLG